MKDIDAITLRDAREYFTTYYAPNNATVFVVGSVDPLALRPKMERLFGTIPVQPSPLTVTDTEPEQQGERRQKLLKAAELPAVVIGFRAAEASSQDFYPLSLLATILSRGKSSRLYRTLVYDHQIANDVSAGVDEFIDPGLFSFYVQMRPGKDVADAEREIYRIIADVSKDGVTAEELQKAKNAVQVGYVARFKTNASIAERLGYYKVVHGDYRKSFDVPALYDRVQADDIRRAAAKYLVERARNVIILVPTHPGEETESGQSQ
jgi:predicted Zn-dependent peptidase